jgi:hypothetical protein
LVSSGHSVGKSLLGACLVNWWFDTRKPALCLTTAPTDRQVKDILWKEVRTLRIKAGLPDHFSGPKIPRLETAPDHFAHGYTARDATRFHGQHSSGGLLIIFDEAEGIEPPFWQALKTMLDDKSLFVGFYNPTTPGSAAHQEEQKADDAGIYKRITLSCLDHPNVKAQLNSEEPPIPGAINLGQLRSMMLEDSTLLTPEDEKLPTDVMLGSECFRPGPVAEARCLGRRPSTSTTGVWSEMLWKQVMTQRHNIQPHWPVVVGCDVGRYGDDQSVITVRKGYCLLHIEHHIKQNTKVIANRLRDVCDTFKDEYNPRQRIVCHVDEGGIGGCVIDQAEGFLFVPVNAACKPRRADRYRLVREELWFTLRQAAAEGLVDFSRIPAHYFMRLKQELLVARYNIVPGTDKVKVESKDDMKARLGRSPDLADSVCLCYYPPGIMSF